MIIFAVEKSTVKVLFFLHIELNADDGFELSSLIFLTG